MNEKQAEKKRIHDQQIRDDRYFLTVNWTSDMDDVISFKDDTGTIFVRGPFEVNGIMYDYQMLDADGEDYCNTDQMLEWKVVMVKKLS